MMSAIGSATGSALLQGALIGSGVLDGGTRIRPSPAAATRADTLSACDRRRVFDRYLHVLVYAVILLSFSQLVVALSHPGVPATHDSAAHFTYTYLFDRALAARTVPGALDRVGT